MVYLYYAVLLNDVDVDELSNWWWTDVDVEKNVQS